jgi:DNA-binding FadR family transcriptional regulator
MARISVPKPSHVLAERLRDSILRGEIPEGQSLPPERELVEQTGLTRGAVREALRTLAVEGLVHTRNGRFGGSVVTLPGNDSIAAAVDRFVKGRKVSLRALQETREVLEPFLARCAASRRTPAHVNELNELHAELQAAMAIDDFHGFTAGNIKWHNAVARASGNEMLAALLYSLSHGIYVATVAEEYNTRETREQVLRIHGKINDAIEAGNADAAERSMRQHMTATHARPLAINEASIPLSDATKAPAARKVGARKARA